MASPSPRSRTTSQGSLLHSWVRDCRRVRSSRAWGFPTCERSLARRVFGGVCAAALAFMPGGCAQPDTMSLHSYLQCVSGSTFALRVTFTPDAETVTLTPWILRHVTDGRDTLPIAVPPTAPITVGRPVLIHVRRATGLSSFVLPPSTLLLDDSSRAAPQSVRRQTQGPHLIHSQR